MNFSPLRQLLTDAHRSRTFSAACYEIGDHANVLARDDLGTLSWGGPQVRPDTPFDVASVTKPIVGLLAMVLFEAGELGLDDTVGTYLPEYAGSDKEPLTVHQLLTHSSGIPGQQPLYRTADTPEQLLAAIRALPLAFRPGQGVAYSSQGFIVLGQILEKVAGEPLDQCLPRLVLEPLGMTHTTYSVAEDERGRTAATEWCPWRERLVQGTVHDENAHVLGGCAGHAGLFSTVEDLGRLCRMMLGTGRIGQDRLLHERTVELMTAPHTDHLPLRRCLAWQGHDAKGGPAGGLVSGRSYGHTGFTGTSVWIDPELDLYIVLLTNAVHPQRRPERIGQLRPTFHDLAVACSNRSAGDRLPPS